MGTQLRSPKRGQRSLPNFRPISIVTKRLDGGCTKMSLGMELGLSPGDFVFDGDPAPLPKKGRSLPCLKFSADVYCGQTAGWIKMALGTEVGSGPGPIVLNGDPAVPFLGGSWVFSSHPAPPKRGTAPMYIVATRSPISATAEHLFRSRPIIFLRKSFCGPI